MRLLERSGCHHDISERVEVPVEAERTPGPRQIEDGQAFLHAPAARAGIDAAHFILECAVADANTNFETTTRNVIEDRALLRQMHRVPQRQDVHVRAYPDAAGALCEQGQEDGSRGSVAVVAEQVLLDEKTVETHSLGLAEQP
jgi:hypothetical protein